LSQCILAIDQGTTGTTVLVIDANGRIRGRSYSLVRQYYPQPGWVEHDAEQIYRSVVRLGREAIAKARLRPGDLAAVGLTNQRETFVVWERRSGRPLHRAIVWQCRRSADICNRLRDREAEVTEHTGLLIDPYFSGTKLKWLLDHDPALRRRARRGELCFGTIDTWLIFKLSRGASFVTDFTNASRTLMFNLDRLEWDPTMIDLLGVPRELLPTPMPSRGPLAEVAGGIFGNRAIPIAASIGDQQAALFGQGGVAKGDAKVTYGTGAFLLMHTGSVRPRSHNRLLSTVALGPAGEPAYALEGSVFIAGAAVQWLRDELKLVAESADTHTLAVRSRDRSAPYFVPAFVGLGAPHWDSAARGAIFGLTRGTTRSDLVRATLDSIAYQVNDVLIAMEHDGRNRIRRLRVDGGAAANDYLMQFQADLFGRPVLRPSMSETTVLGTAILAGLAAGLWRLADDLKSARKLDRTFRPRMRLAERKRLVAGWRDAVSRTLSAPAGKVLRIPGEVKGIG
jgi:glycerol kinase